MRINTTMAATANYNIDQGTTFSSTVTVKDNAGTALDLTGYTATAKWLWDTVPQEHEQI